MNEAKQPIRTIVVKGVRADIARPEDFGDFVPSQVVGHIGRGDNLPALEIRVPLTGNDLSFSVVDTLTKVEARVKVQGALNGIAEAIKSYLQRDVELKRRLDSAEMKAKERITKANGSH